jgi:hypothetical protein
MALAVPAPPVRGAGAKVTGSIYQSDVTDSVNFLTNPPVFQGYQTAAQSIANSTLVATALDTTGVDTYAGHSNSVNNSRYTPTVAGYYLCLGQVGYAVNASVNRLALFYKNGTAVNLGQSGIFTTTAANFAIVPATALIYCNGSTDYIEIWAYQNSGGALNTVPSQTGFVALFVHA